MVSKSTQPDDIASVVSTLRSRRGLVIVVSAPSGAGKTTVCERLLAEMPELRMSVSFTTRRPRRGEKNEQHYHFVTKRKFREERDRGRFLEWAEVHGHFYGTPRDFIEKRIRSGKDTVLDIDVQGARAVKEAIPGAVLIFLLPPSLAELEQRLRARSSDSARDIGIRIRKAAAEFSCYPHMHDYLVINEDIEEAVGNLQAIIKAERCRVGRAKPISSWSSE